MVTSRYLAPFDLKHVPHYFADVQHQGGGEPVQEAMAGKHRELSGQHKTQHEAHERIKKHHHTVMAHLTMLKTAIEAAV